LHLAGQGPQACHPNGDQGKATLSLSRNVTNAYLWFYRKYVNSIGTVALVSSALQR